MFEAYKIGIRLSLINNVTSGLSVIAGNFKAVHKDATDLQNKLKEIKLLGAAGIAIGGAGFMGLGIVAKMIKPAEEYAHQMNILNMAGLKQKEIADVVGDSWKNTGKILTTTVTSNMRDLLDLRNVLGDLGEARTALPVFTKIQAVMSASNEGKVSAQSQNFAYSMAKALDIVGAVRDPHDFMHQAEMMSKVIIATQGRVTPEAYKSVFQYARQAKIGMNDEFKYEILPTLIQENAPSQGSGGGSRGVGPMLSAMYRWTNQGLVNKNTIPELRSLGLYKGNALGTTTSGTTLKSPLTQHRLAAENPFEWVNNVVVPAIYKKYGNISDKDMVFKLASLTTGNQLAGNMLTEFFYKNKNFLRDQRIVRGTMNSDDAFSASMSNDPVTARRALSAQWENVKVAMTMSLVPTLVPFLINVASGFNKLSGFMREHQTVMKYLTHGFVLLCGSMAIIGTVTALTAGFKTAGVAMKLLEGVGVTGLSTALGKAGLLGVLISLIPVAYELSKTFDVGAKAFESSHSYELNKATGQMEAKTGSILTYIFDKYNGLDTKMKWQPGSFYGSGFDAIGPRNSKKESQHITMNMDGRVVGQIVTDHQTASASRNVGQSNVDVRNIVPIPAWSR